MRWLSDAANRGYLFVYDTEKTKYTHAFVEKNMNEVICIESHEKVSKLDYPNHLPMNLLEGEEICPIRHKWK